MAIEDRNLAVGTKLVARYKGKEYAAEVVKTEEGVRYRLEDGREFKSPSSAGSAVMGGSACNGWRFWSLDGQQAKPRERKAEKSDTVGFRRIPGGRAWCNGCAAAFKVEAGTTPATCPQGHTPDLDD